MTSVEEIAIEEFHNKLSISKIDLRLILFLWDGADISKFRLKYNLSHEQVERSIERLISVELTRCFVLTNQGRELSKKIRNRISELESYS